MLDVCLNQAGRRRVTLVGLWATVLVLLAFAWVTKPFALAGWRRVWRGCWLSSPAPAAIIAENAPKDRVAP